MREEEESRLLPILVVLAMNPVSRTDPRKPAKPDEECFLAASMGRKKKKKGIQYNALILSVIELITELQLNCCFKISHAANVLISQRGVLALCLLCRCMNMHEPPPSHTSLFYTVRSHQYLGSSALPQERLLWSCSFTVGKVEQEILFPFYTCGKTVETHCCPWKWRSCMKSLSGLLSTVQGSWPCPLC